jgi:SNF2 family DNA or RNA helicase
VEELWSLLHFIAPNSLRDLEGFLEKYGSPDDAGTLRSLQDVLRPYMLRRKKGEVEKTLGTKEETIIEVKNDKDAEVAL